MAQSKNWWQETNILRCQNTHKNDPSYCVKMSYTYQDKNSDQSYFTKNGLWRNTYCQLPEEIMFWRLAAKQSFGNQINCIGVETQSVVFRTIVVFQDLNLDSLESEVKYLMWSKFIASSVKNDLLNVPNKLSNYSFFQLSFKRVHSQTQSSWIILKSSWTVLLYLRNRSHFSTR